MLNILTLSFFILCGTAISAPIKSHRQQVIKLVARIQKADYQGNRDALARLDKEIATFADDLELGTKIHYWRGFARWRRALNGFNDSVDRVELEADLKQAVREFELAYTKEPAFVDAKIAAGSCLFNLLFLHQKDVDEVNSLLAKALPLVKGALDSEPDNPRLLWVLGANRWYLGPERGGGEEKAIETYQKGLKAIRERKSCGFDMLSPSWGEPELLMNLAWSNLNRKSPDLSAAERYAREALALVPYWHYVKDILIPQIAAAKAKQGL